MNWRTGYLGILGTLGFVVLGRGSSLVGKIEKIFCLDIQMYVEEYGQMLSSR